MAKSAESTQEIVADEAKLQDKKKRGRRFTYLLVSWSIQSFCAVLISVLLIWGVIQFMRIWGVLGITSQEPPGLYVVDFEPNPPPPPPPTI